jgi:hypothetical protein
MGIGDDMVRLSDEDVPHIRTLYASGDKPIAVIAAEYRVGTRRISRIVHGLDRLAAGGPISDSANKINHRDPATGRIAAKPSEAV